MTAVAAAAAEAQTLSARPPDGNPQALFSPPHLGCSLRMSTNLSPLLSSRIGRSKVMPSGIVSFAVPACLGEDGMTVSPCIMLPGMLGVSRRRPV